MVQATQIHELFGLLFLFYWILFQRIASSISYNRLYCGGVKGIFACFLLSIVITLFICETFLLSWLNFHMWWIFTGLKHSMLLTKHLFSPCIDLLFSLWKKGMVHSFSVETNLWSPTSWVRIRIVWIFWILMCFLYFGSNYLHYKVTFEVFSSSLGGVFPNYVG